MFLLLVCRSFSLKLATMRLNCIPQSSANIFSYQNSRTMTNKIKLKILLILGVRCVFFNTFRMEEYQNDYFRLKSLECEDDSRVDAIMCQYDFKFSKRNPIHVLC